MTGVVTLARGEYVAALDLLFSVGNDYWGDIAYVAERVLTVDELKAFVDAKVPRTDGRQIEEPGSRERDGMTFTHSLRDTSANLRDLLARRLVRHGRFQQALPYFQDPDVALKVVEYTQALADAKGRWFAVGRAKAGFDAAVLLRESGWDMMASEGDPDGFVWDGNYFGSIGPVEKERNGALGSEGERQRFAASKIEPNRRFHYRYLAAAQAVAAAEQLPARSQAYAAVLCTATGWMIETRPSMDDWSWLDLDALEADGGADKAREIYRLYLKRGALVPWASHFGLNCPEPDFDAAYGTMRRQALHAVRHAVRPYFWPLMGLGALFGLAVVRWRQIRRGYA
jgi:hypothetical protein